MKLANFSRKLVSHAVALGHAAIGIACSGCPSSTVVEQPVPLAVPAPSEPPGLPDTIGSWIAISGLDFGVDDAALRGALTTFGEVRDVRVIMDSESGTSRGYGFVEFLEPEAATAAVTGLDGTELLGRVARVNLAESAKYSGETPTKALSRADGTTRRVGSLVVLEPMGLVGRVGLIDQDEDGAFFAFDVRGGRSRVSTAPESRWRLPMSRAEAAAVVEALAAAAPIPTLTAVDGPPRGWKRDPALATVDRYLDSGRVHQIAALATLLDWAIEAKAAGETRGGWLGRLAVARDRLLGELEAVLGLDGPALLARLLEGRKSGARAPAIDPPPAPQPPLVTLAPDDDPPVGVHALGPLDVSTVVTLGDNGWENDLFPITDPVSVPTAAGTWHAWLIVQDPAMPATLKAEVEAGQPSDAAEELIDAYAFLFRRTWLVITAEAGPPSAPTLDAGPNPSYAQLLAASEAAEGSDPFETSPVGIATTGQGRVPLERAGRVGQWSGQLVVIAASAFTEETARALRSTPIAGVRAWRWGLAWWRRPVETPVLVGGPKDARTWIAVPDPGF